MNVVRWDELQEVAWRNGAGSAVDLHVVPAGAGWDGFEWRANIAWFDRDVPFSSYRGTERHLLVLEGQFTIVVDGVPIRLTPESDVFVFSGDATTEVREVVGMVRVFNVLARGQLDAPALRTTTAPGPLGESHRVAGTDVIHVVSGSATTSRRAADQEMLPSLAAGDTLIGDRSEVEVWVGPESRIVVATAGVGTNAPVRRPGSGPRVIAHRGASGYAPENTRAAFDLAIAMAVDAIETDIRLTSDGVPVLVHDATVDRTSDGQGAVSSLPLSQLARLDFGSWFGGGTGRQDVMTLDQLLLDYGRRIPLVIEIKERAAVEPAMERLQSATCRWEVTSFDWDSVVAARAIFPAGRFGFLSREFDETTINRCVATGLDQICPPASLLTADLVRTAKAAGLEVRAHGVKSQGDVERLFTTEVDGATINWPDWIQEFAPAS